MQHSKEDAATPLTPLSALERQMGIASVSGCSGTPSSEVFDGAIDSDPDATPPPGRAAPVRYSDGDALFADTPPSHPAAQSETAEAEEMDDDEESAASSSEGLGLDANAMLSVLGPGGDASALIAQLEAMAEAFERQSGEPETEIRGKIALLKSVIDARPAAVAQSRARMDAVLRAADSEESDPTPAAAYREEAAIQSICQSSLQNIESEMDAVSSMLQEDPAAAAVVANLVSKPS